MTPKPCPYRREHEFEWMDVEQAWLCRHCFVVNASPDEPTQPMPVVTFGPSFMQEEV